MQIVSDRDNLHEMGNPVFWKKKILYVVCENFTQNAKH